MKIAEIYMVGPQPARYRLAVGSGQKSGRRVGLRFYDPRAPLVSSTSHLLASLAPAFASFIQYDI